VSWRNQLAEDFYFLLKIQGTEIFEGYNRTFRSHHWYCGKATEPWLRFVGAFGTLELRGLD
jgi:hypothetical protein